MEIASDSDSDIDGSVDGMGGGDAGRRGTGDGASGGDRSGSGGVGIDRGGRHGAAGPAPASDPATDSAADPGSIAQVVLLGTLREDVAGDAGEGATTRRLSFEGSWSGRAGEEAPVSANDPASAPASEANGMTGAGSVGARACDWRSAVGGAGNGTKGGGGGGMATICVGGQPGGQEAATEPDSAMVAGCRCGKAVGCRMAAAASVARVRLAEWVGGGERGCVLAASEGAAEG